MSTANHDTLRAQFDADPWPIVGFITTEHNTLTSLRSATIAESSARLSTHLTTLSAALIAVGFVGGAGGGFGDIFFGFGAVVLAVVSVVGLLTFGRCIQSSIEDLRLVARIERIRELYLVLAPGLAAEIRALRSDDPDGLRHSSGMSAGDWTQLALTMAGLVGLVNSAVLTGAAVFVIRLTTGDAALLWVSAAVMAPLLWFAHLAVQMRIMSNALGGRRSKTSAPRI